MDDYMERQDACGIEVGDRVKVLRRAESREDGWPDTWEPEMNGMVGMFWTVKAVGEFGVLIGTHGGWNFPYFVLEKE